MAKGFRRFLSLALTLLMVLTSVPQVFATEIEGTPAPTQTAPVESPAVTPVVTPVAPETPEVTPDASKEPEESPVASEEPEESPVVTEEPKQHAEGCTLAEDHDGDCVVEETKVCEEGCILDAGHEDECLVEKPCTKTEGCELIEGHPGDCTGKAAFDEVLVINDADDLFAFAEAVNAGDDFDGKTIQLAQDIDLAGNEWTPIGGIDASKEFKGEFDGNEKTIKNLTITLGDRGANKVRSGLFASPTEAYIHNFTLDGVKITGSGSDIRVGALAGNLWTGTTVENVTVKNVNIAIDGGSYIGGVAGRVYFANSTNVDAANIKITNNEADGVYIGGFTAHAAGHTASGGAYNWVDENGNRVTNSLFTDCDLNGVDIDVVTAKTATYVGGFVSSNQYNNSENFYVDCNIEGLDIDATGYSAIIGGFIAESYGQSTTQGYSFKDCSVQGSINGTAGTYGGFIGVMLGRAKAYAGASADVDINCSGTAGGFVGKTAHTHQNNATNTQKVSFTDCSATGNVTGSIAGGFIGNITIGNDASRRIEFTATNCTAAGDVNGTEAAGGFAGQIDGTRVSVADSYATLEKCSATGVVTGTEGNTAGLIGYIKGNANNKTAVSLENVTANGENLYNAADDGVVINTVNNVAKVGETNYDTLEKAVAAANAVEGGATVELLMDVELGEKLIITGNVTISGEHTITRADAYPGTLFAVNAGATLTLDGGLTIDGGNEWTMDMDAYNDDLKALAKISDGNKYFTPEEGAPVADAHMITVSGVDSVVNLNKVTIKNHYATAEKDLVSAGTGATVNLTGATITHNAITAGSGLVVNASSGKWDTTPVIWVNMNEGTVIDGNHVGGNHGIFKVYMGTVFTMNGGSIKNTTGWNSNGSAVGVYWATFNMNGGEICSNSSVYGPNNGRNAPVYLHSASIFEMTDGSICHNVGGSRSGLDAPYADSTSNGVATITGGYIGENSSYYSENGVEGYNPDVTAGDKLVISGGTFTQDVTEWLVPDCGAKLEDGKYTLTEDLYEYNGDAYQTLSAAIAAIAGTPAAADGDESDAPVIKVLASHKVDDPTVIGTDLVLDLNGKTITGVQKDGVYVYPVIRVEKDANVTVTGNGSIVNGDYVFVLGASNGSTAGNLTIENGTFKGETTVASVTKGTLTINGGEFSVEPYDGSYEYTLNCIDANYKDGSAKIVVKGGKFYKFNPADNAAEGAGTSFLDSNCVAEADGEGWYTVRTAEFVAELNGKKYETLQAAVDACVEGNNTIKLLKNISQDVTIKQTKGVNITIDGGFIAGGVSYKRSFDETFTIHGNARYTGEETLTFKNIAFITSEKDHYFIDANSTGSVERYAHNVTVENCTFTADGDAVNTAVAVRIRQGYDITIKHSRGSVTAQNMHSLLQAYGCAGVTVDYVHVKDCKNGLSMGTSTNVKVTNSTIETTGYGLRADGSGAYDMTVENCTITANDPIVVRNATGAYTLTLDGTNKLTAVNGGGYQVIFTNGDDGTYVTPTGKFVLTGAETYNVFPKAVAQIGETLYYSLKEALEACTKGETVKLIADITYDEDDVEPAHGGATGFGKYDASNPSIIYIGGTKGATDAENKPSTVNAVLDLNGYTITNNADAYLFLIMDNAKLTIKDSGNGDGIIGTTKWPVLWVTGAETLVTIESGKYTTANDEGLIWSTHSGDLVITGGEFSTTADDASLLIMLNTKEFNNPNYFLKGVATVKISGGTFHGFDPEKVKDDSQVPFLEANGCVDGFVSKPNDNGSYVVEKWNLEIWDVNDLMMFARMANDGNTFADQTVKLMADIDLEWAEWAPIYKFEGTFEGNNKKISNLTYVANSSGNLGFFNDLTGTAKDLTIDGIKANATVANGRFGGFARILYGEASNVLIKNMEVDLEQPMVFVGGFTGYAYGYATGCTVDTFKLTAVASEANIGGFVGSVNCSHTFKNCKVSNFTADVAGKGGGVAIAGFVAHTQTGWNNPKFENCDVENFDFTATGGFVDAAGFTVWPGAHTHVTNCDVTGVIDATKATNSLGIGGFVAQLGWNHDYGQMGHKFTNCTADVDITTKVAVAGGFVGSATNATDSSMYATFDGCVAKGNVTCVEGGTANIGGFGGSADRGYYKNCSATGDVENNGTGVTGGFIGKILDVNPKYDYRYPAGTRDYLVDVLTFENCTGAAEPFIGEVVSSKPANELVNINSYVAKVGDALYAKFDAALDAAKASEGKAMTLLAPVVLTEDTTIDLGGVTITTAETAADVYVDAFVVLADVTITGNGIVDAKPSHGYAFYIGDKAGKAGNLTIEGGTFYGDTSVAQVTTGTLTITGGEFTVKPYEESYKYTLNCLDDNYKNDTAKIEVKGGKFYKFNPENNEAEGVGTNFVAEGYISVAEGDYFIVKEDPNVAQIGNKKYVELEKAIEEVKPGETIVMLKDTEETVVATVIPADTTLDLNGKTVGVQNLLAFGEVIDTADEVGGVKVTNDTSNAFVILQPNNSYLPIYDTNTGSYKFFEYKVEEIRYKETEDNTNTIKVRARFDFVNYEAYRVLATTESSGFDFIVNISWADSETPIRYTFKDSTIKSWAAQTYNDRKIYRIFVNLYGLDSFENGEGFTSVAEVVSVTHVGAKCDPVEYKVTK